MASPACGQRRAGLAPAGRGNQLQHLPAFALRLRAFAKRRYCRPNEKILEGVVDLQINEDGNE